MPVPTSWHPGEIAAQQARGYEDDVWGMWENYETGAPSFMLAFLHALPFLSVTSLDNELRPWTSLLSNDGRPGFLVPVQGAKGSRMQCTIRAPAGVPIRECLLRLRAALARGEGPYDEAGDARPAFQIAAVGVMLHNRRRNKMEGVVVSVGEDGPGDRLVFQLDVTSTFGNCPKYINTRLLLPADDGERTTVTEGGGGALPAEVLSIVAGADVLFLSTKHTGAPDAYPADPPRAGNNIRGGPPGFLRSYWDDEAAATCIVLPDWSGNRLMQSFGNMTTDPVAGITIPVWSSKQGQASDVLHLTCDALVLANDSTRQLIGGVHGAVKLWPRRWTLVRRGLPVVAAVDEQRQVSVGWSPYNPPVRLLNSEKPSLGLAPTQPRPTATLVDVDMHSPTVATFTFQADGPLAYTPGQHIVLDCWALLDTRVQLYSHMASFRGGEKDLNDDGTRSWTVSHAEMPRFQVTLRRKDRGAVTPNLFHQARNLRQALDDGDDSWNGRTTLPVLGVDGACVVQGPGEHETKRLVYLVSGIGLTPMLPHLTQLAQAQAGSAHVLAVMAVRSGEVALTRGLLQRALLRGSQKDGRASVHVQAYLLVRAEDGGAEEAWTDPSPLPSRVTLDTIVVSGKRLHASSLAADGDNDAYFQLPSSTADDLASADNVVICAGDAFAKIAHEATRRASIPQERILLESFLY